MKVAILSVAAVAAVGVSSEAVGSSSSAAITGGPSTSYVYSYYDDCVTESSAQTNTIIKTACHECEEASSASAASAFRQAGGVMTTYTTVFSEFCPTGVAEKTYTVTESCSESVHGQPRPSDHVPQGFTVTTATCHVCGPNPVVATLTTPTPAPTAPAPAPAGPTPAGDSPSVGSSPGGTSPGGSAPPNSSPQASSPGGSAPQGSSSSPDTAPADGGAAPQGSSSSPDTAPADGGAAPQGSSPQDSLSSPDTAAAAGGAAPQGSSPQDSLSSPDTAAAAGGAAPAPYAGAPGRYVAAPTGGSGTTERGNSSAPLTPFTGTASSISTGLTLAFGFAGLWALVYAL